MKIAGSRSISQRHGSADPDPHQHVMDPQHCIFPFFELPITIPPFSVPEAVISRPECVVDSDCPSRLACMQETCRNPCPALSPCGRNAECSVQNTAPSRTMVCMCLPGYVGDANVACNLRKTFTWANTLYIYYFYLLALVETAVRFSLVMHSVAIFAPCPASCFRKAGGFSFQD